jgi:hypothetical protein
MVGGQQRLLVAANRTQQQQQQKRPQLQKQKQILTSTGHETDVITTKNEESPLPAQQDHGN